MQKVLALESSLSKEIWWITTPLEIYKTRYSRMLKNILNRLALQIEIAFYFQVALLTTLLGVLFNVNCNMLFLSTFAVNSIKIYQE